MNRRTASGLLVVGTCAVAAGTVGVPVLLAAISPALRSRRETWRPIGELEMFPIGSVTQAVVVHDRESWPAAYGERGVFVWRPVDADLVVYSRQCTDLGCPLEYERGSGCFLCPCHGGIFGPDGQRLAGPPKSPLHRYAHRIREAILEVDISSIPPAA